MVNGKTFFATLLITLTQLTSCAQQPTENPKESTVEEVTIDTKKTYKPHKYGGWYCPDNFGGFPPMDVQDLDQLSVITDRLPTKEEAKNGTSLMYFDQAEYPEASPLKIKLPRVAKIHSQHSGLDEIIIVIQAAVIGNDTVLGYRFPSGGNGTARIGEVTFLSDSEVNAEGSKPMVYMMEEMSGTKEDVWNAFTHTKYAESLGKTFNEQAFFDAEWKPDSRLHLEAETESMKAIGYVSNLFGNIYLHVDYDYHGFHYTEKMLLGENAEENTAELHFVSGPFPNDIDNQKIIWSNFVEEVKELSTKN
jgi:hypothetical protein